MLVRCNKKFAASRRSLVTGHSYVAAPQHTSGPRFRGRIRLEVSGQLFAAFWWVECCERVLDDLVPAACGAGFSDDFGVLAARAT